MQPGAVQQRAKYSLPTVALVLSIVGVCLCPSSVVGAVLAVVALLRIRKEPQLQGKGMAIAALVIAVGLLPFQAGVVAAIAIPNLIRVQARAKQAECKMNLRNLAAAQVRYRAEHGQYATGFGALGFSVPAGNRYAYLLSDAEVLPVDPRYGAGRIDPVSEARRRGLDLGAGPDLFLAACIGNVDNDPTLDVWTVSSEDRTGPEGVVPGGQPRNDVNDVVE